MARKLSITDARKTYPDASREALETLAKSAGHICLAAFVGNSKRARATCWAEGERELAALETWAALTLRSFEGLGQHHTALSYFGKGCCVLVGVEANGEARCVTWATTKADCDGMKGWSDTYMWPAFSAAPFRTHFGWGFGGVPTPLTSAELLSLTPNQRDWIERNFP